VHWLLVAAICIPLRLDAAIAYLAANISNPFVAPFLVLAEVQIGSVILTGHSLALTARDLSDRGIGGLLAQTAVGTAVLSPGLAFVLGALTFGLVSLVRPRRGACDGS
jgi:uncharacterized protein (DUF2062 family)